MKYFLICGAAFLTSGLTLFSGFGLGTLLMPVFAVFFPLAEAVALTAVVHLFNNLFKFVLLGKFADKGTVLRFGVPAAMSAWVGAQTLVWLAGLNPWGLYRLAGHECRVTPVNVVVAFLMVVFALFEIVPRWAGVSFDRKFLPWGGILSGFFGGISGHQGALRSAFLLRSGLSKESFLGTGVVVACLVDVTRIAVYAAKFSSAHIAQGSLLLAAVISAWGGAFAGARLMEKVTLRAMQILVAVLLFVIALSLGSGLL